MTLGGKGCISLEIVGQVAFLGLSKQCEFQAGTCGVRVPLGTGGLRTAQGTCWPPRPSCLQQREPVEEAELLGLTKPAWGCSWDKFPVR